MRASRTAPPRASASRLGVRRDARFCMNSGCCQTHTHASLGIFHRDLVAAIIVEAKQPAATAGAGGGRAKRRHGYGNWGVRMRSCSG
jgi:hypothetical protein